MKLRDDSRVVYNYKSTAAKARQRAANSGEKYNAPIPHSVIAVIVIPNKLSRKTLPLA